MSANTIDMPAIPKSTRTLDISLLPLEIFWMILRNLDPRDIVRCRRISKSWNEAFGNPVYLLRLMKEIFPFAKEIRELYKEDYLDELLSKASDDSNWRNIFDQVASRYDHLGRGKPRSIQKYKLCEDFGITGQREWFQVQPWESHASHLMHRVDLLFPETFWTYEDGLFVYPSADCYSLVLMDLDNDKKFIVPFVITGKVVRRVRLQKRVLVVEWAEPKAFHWLNDSDGVHRHFASSFDVIKSASGWNVIFRNEWKIMFLGHPLSERDRFYSTHSKTHYVIYIWQPNRSLYTADDDAPIESLFVWDISKPSAYRPSLDPTGHLRDDEQDQGPSIISRFGFRDLGFYEIRQRGIPRLQSLEITDDEQSIEVVEHICTGPVDRLVGPANWTSKVEITSIPLIGDGPCWRRDTNFMFPAYRGSSNLQTRSLALSDDRFWYTAISEAFDEDAETVFCLRLSPFAWPFDLKIYLSIQTLYSSIVLNSDDSLELAGKGKICGNERYVVGENGNRELVVWRFDK